MNDPVMQMVQHPWASSAVQALRWRQGWCATHQRAARILTLHMDCQLVDERGGMARQQTPRISCQHGPAADRSVAVQERYGAQAVKRQGHR